MTENHESQILIENIVNNILDNVRVLSGQDDIGLDQRIFVKSDMIDSFQMLNLIVHLEELYQIKIDAFFEERMSVTTIRDLSEYIYGKIEKKDC